MLLRFGRHWQFSIFWYSIYQNKGFKVELLVHWNSYFQFHIRSAPQQLTHTKNLHVMTVIDSTPCLIKLNYLRHSTVFKACTLIYKFVSRCLSTDSKLFFNIKNVFFLCLERFRHNWNWASQSRFCQISLKNLLATNF